MERKLQAKIIQQESKLETYSHTMQSLSSTVDQHEESIKDLQQMLKRKEDLIEKLEKQIQEQDLKAFENNKLLEIYINKVQSAESKIQECLTELEAEQKKWLETESQRVALVNALDKKKQAVEALSQDLNQAHQ